MWPNPQLSADLVTFTEEILNGKFRFLRSLHDNIVLKWVEEHPHIIRYQNGTDSVFIFFKFNNGNTGMMCEICSKLTINIPEKYASLS